MPPKRGRGRGGRYGGAGFRRDPASASAEAMDSFLAGAMSGFSMRDEARNTNRDHLKWDRDEGLRFRPMTFVSAGFIEPLKDFQTGLATTKPEESASTDPQPDVGKQSPEPVAVEEALETNGPPTTTTLPVPPAPAHTEPTAANASFFVDTAGDKTLRQTATAPVKIPARNLATSKEDDSSEEEVILFKGRAPSTKIVQSRITVHHTRRDLEAVERRLEVRPKEAPKQSKVEVSKSRSRSRSKSTSKSRSRSRSRSQPQPELQMTRPALLPRSQADPNSGPTRTAEDSRFAKANRQKKSTGRGTESARIGNDDDHLSDYINNMDGIEDLIGGRNPFLRRDLGGGNDVVLSEDHGDSGASPSGDSDDLEGTDAIADGDQSAEASDGDGWAVDIDDGELARLLAKQEALGLGGDELVLFDEAAAPRSRAARRKVSHAAKKSTKPPPNSASAVAQVFDELDIVMDWNQPVPPRRKSKAKLGEAKFDVADDELRANMEASYEKDRLKKTERKREREELRVLGLLGKNANPNDPRVKYPDGINLVQLEEELRTFLQGSDQILTLPPMDASARKIIHEVANRLKIKSKSSGSGDQRRPVLSRTKNTFRYDEFVLQQTLARVHRKSFPRLDKQRRGGAGGGGNGSGFASLRYKDGEVVGGDAPELGETNKGRAMLEKMGWTKGTGLGALDNKGILEPVAHVVKMSKAGLG